MKDINIARKFLRENENKGEEPHTKVYEDHKLIPTISTGFNLTRKDAEKVITSVGGDFRKIMAGTDKLTPEQALKIEEYILSEAEEILIRKIGKGIYDNLGANQQASLISLCVNGPSLIGPNLKKLLKANKHDEVVEEIQKRSNKDHHHGLQNRRDREAELYKKDIISKDSPNPAQPTKPVTPAGPEVLRPAVVVNSSPSDAPLTGTHESSQPDVAENESSVTSTIDSESISTMLNAVNPVLASLFDDYAALSLADLISYEEQILKLHVPRKLTIKNLPFKKDDAFFDEVRAVVKHKKESMVLDSLQLESTFVFFGTRFPANLMVESFSKLWESALDDSVPDVSGKTFNFDKVLAVLPVIKFSLPRTVNLNEIMPVANGVLQPLTKIPGVSLTTQLPDSTVLIEAKNKLMALISKTPEGIVTLGIQSTDEARHYAVKIDGIKTHGELARLVDNITVTYASSDMPLLGIAAGTTVNANMNLQESSIFPIRKAAELCGLDGTQRVAIIINDDGYEFNLSAPAARINLGSVVISNLNLTYNNTTQKISIAGKMEIDFFGKNYSMDGVLSILPDGMIEGKFRLMDGKEIYLDPINLYMSDISIIVRTALDQGIKAGVEGDLTLKPRKECSSTDIGKIKYLPGAVLLNSDFEAEFPAEFNLSLAQALSLVARQPVKLPDIFDPIQYSGYERDGHFYKLTFRYLPSEMNFGIQAATNVLGHRALISELIVNPNKIHAYIELPRFHEGDYFIIEHPTEKKGPVLALDIPSPSALAVANLSELGGCIQAKIKVFGFEQEIKTVFNAEVINIDIHNHIKIIPGLETDTRNVLIINFPQKTFALCTSASVGLKLALSNKIFGSLDLASVTVELNMSIESEKKSIDISGSFHVGPEKVTFKLGMNLYDVQNILNKVEDAANTALNNCVNGKYEKDIREFLAKLDPTNNPEVRKVLDKAQEHYERIERDARSAAALIDKMRLDALKRAQREAEEAAEQTKRAAEAAERATREAAERVAEEAERVAKEAKHAAEEAERKAREAAAEAERKAREAAAEAERKTREAAAEAKRAAEEAQRKAQEALKNAGKKLKKAFGK